MPDARVISVEWARLEGRRPREAKANSRSPGHGNVVRPPIARVRLEDGSSGFGWSLVSRDRAEALLGRTLGELFEDGVGATDGGQVVEYPLWDLVATRAGRPVYALGAEASGVAVPARLEAPCYDTSLYLDDMHLVSDDEGAALIAGEAREGWERGHRAFKIKVGRGARFMPLEEGTRRDIAVVRAVRAAVGSDAPIMIDANNGYNLNLAKRVLEGTADCRLLWLEEAFHEDPLLYVDLREWLRARGLDCLIADGEGLAAPTLMDWARDGVVDVIQYDIFSPGFTRWLRLGRQLDEWGRRSAPHHYGGHLGNYVSCHLAPAVRGFTFTEWDEATTPGLGADGYAVRDGRVIVPDAPGFGLTLDDEVFGRAVRDQGFAVRA